MTYTTHGHYIPRTVHTVKAPINVKRCGGPGVCTTCSAEAYQQINLKDVEPTEVHISNNDEQLELAWAEREKEKKIKTTTYQRIPFEVEAVQVTEENFEDVATWCGGSIVSVQEPQEGFEGLVSRRYVAVDVDRPLSRRQTEAHIGDWILYASKGFKVYANRPFSKNFEEKNAPKQSEVNQDAMLMGGC